MSAGASDALGNHADLLRQKIALVQPRLVARADRVWRHPRLADSYADLIVSFHGFTRASVPLMEAASDRARESRSEDPVCGPLVDYLEHHIAEERHHDEWLIEDLEVLGVTREAALSRLPSPTVASLVGAQYYWIHHVHPIAVLGYIAVLEGEPASEEFIEGLILSSGLPRDAFRTLLKHAHLDPGHRDDLDRFLSRLPLEPRHASLVGISAFHTSEHFGRVFEEFADRHGLAENVL